MLFLYTYLNCEPKRGKTNKTLVKPADTKKQDVCDYLLVIRAAAGTATFDENHDDQHQNHT